jgi:signal transduction histidine kinase
MNGSRRNYILEIFSKKDTKSSKVQVFSFVVKDTFWQRSYFLPSVILYILLFFGVGVYLFSLYKLRQKLKLQYVRNKIASDLHDEVGSNLNAIAIFVDLLKKKLPKNSPELMDLATKITTNSEETVSLMRDTVWAINPENDSSELLFEKMESHGLEILSAKGIAFNFESNKRILENQFSMEQRKNIFLVFKEALSNIVKHANATKVTCSVFFENNTTRITISDNGVGFNTDAKYNGFGLNSFKIRNIEDELKIKVSSEVGKGTKVFLEIF